MVSNKKKQVLVTKASGELQEFDEEKLVRSLLQAGADGNIAAQIKKDIRSWLTDGISTQKIYSRAFQLLRKKKTVAAMRYRLKKAMFDLGPSGYPFEQLAGQLFVAQGYVVSVGEIVRGVCVSHEMDVIATKGITQHLIECKYSQDHGKNISIQTPLYVKARVDDIVAARKGDPQFKGFRFKGWLVTNTRFSTDSVDYAECVGLQLLSWDYPVNKGIKDLITQYHIFPITILQHLSLREKRWLMEQEIITCQQLYMQTEALHEFHLTTAKMQGLMQELQTICES